jgi:hypothetical protein
MPVTSVGAPDAEEGLTVTHDDHEYVGATFSARLDSGDVLEPIFVEHALTAIAAVATATTAMLRKLKPGKE